MSSANRFNIYVNKLGTALQLTESSKKKLLGMLEKFSNDDKLKIMEITSSQVTALESVDNELSKLINSGVLNQYKDQIIDGWNAMNEQLAELQILSLITKSKEDCSKVINSLSEVLNKKITKVNEILRNNLNTTQSGGANNDIYMNKYLKYKNKYMSLKKKY
jgi:hypothetical protein